MRRRNRVGSVGSDGSGMRQTLFLGSENRPAEFAIARIIGDVHHPGGYLFFGVSGVGKSLIARCVAHYWTEKNGVFGNQPVLMTNGGDWARHVDGLGNETGKAPWLTTGEQISLFVIEDLDELVGYPRAQYELTLLFDDLMARNVPFVASCQLPPSELPGLDPRLNSRLLSGHLVKVHLPSRATKRAFVDSLDLNNDVRRGLEGLIDRSSSLQQVKAVANQLSVQGTTAADRTPSPEAVIRACARYYDVSMKQIRGSSRRRAIALARQVVVFLLRDELAMPLKQIGHLLGNRDHSTILHAYRKISQAVADDAAMYTTINDLRLSLQRLTEKP